MPPLSSVQSLPKKNPQKETRQPECGLKAQDIVVKPIINMAWINGLPLQQQYHNRWCVHAKHCRAKLIINRKKKGTNARSSSIFSICQVVHCQGDDLFCSRFAASTFSTVYYSNVLIAWPHHHLMTKLAWCMCLQPLNGKSPNWHFFFSNFQNIHFILRWKPGY